MKLSLIPAVILSAFSPLFLATNGAGQESPHRIEIVARRFDFTPGDVTLKKGVPVTISLTSQDVDHGVRFKDLNVSITAKKGEVKEVTFTPEKAGIFVGQCSVFCGPGHGSMKMTLHVTE
jgi:cytochrome c oxidase subunit II